MVSHSPKSPGDGKAEKDFKGYEKNAAYREKAAYYDKKLNNKKEQARNLFIAAKSRLIVGDVDEAGKDASVAYEIYLKLDRKKEGMKALQIVG